MPALTDTLDLGRMQLLSGQGRRFDLHVHLDPFEFGEDSYPVTPDPLPVRLDVSRTTHRGYALRLRFSAALNGPCMRCLADASPSVDVDAREVDQPGEGEELQSPYMDDPEVLDVSRWARDALALALPVQVLCKEDCLGLCAECGIDLNTAPADHHHDRPRDPRWSALSKLTFE